MKVRTHIRNDYPTSDGRPVAETDTHRDLMFELITILRHWFASDPNVYVSGNLLLFYAQGDRRRHVSPDVFVSFGIPNHPRDNYLLWEEVSPAIVIELTSSSTHREDQGRKFELYRDTMGVAEYILFDPQRHYLTPPLQGYRLVRGEYRPMRLQRNRLRSRQLGLWIEYDTEGLYFVDPDTGERLQRPDVSERARAEVAEEKLELAEEKLEVAEEKLEIAEQKSNLLERERDALAKALQTAQKELAEMRERTGQSSA